MTIMPLANADFEAHCKRTFHPRDSFKGLPDIDRSSSGECFVPSLMPSRLRFGSIEQWVSSQAAKATEEPRRQRATPSKGLFRAKHQTLRLNCVAWWVG